MDKRTFLTTGLTAGIGGLGLAASAALAQAPRLAAAPAAAREIPVRKAKTTPLFLTPPGWPNGIAVDPARGFWVQEQRHDGEKEKAWLVDWNGKLLNTVVTNC